MIGEQLSLFDLPEPEPEEVVDGLECNNCGIVQPYDKFSSITYASGKVEFKRICSSCRKGHQKLLKVLKEENPYPPDDYCCPICKRDIDEIGRKGQKRMQSWVLDHCHDTETFRGWVCHHCNTGLGGFSDDLKRVKSAATYLQKHKDKIND